MRWTLWLLVACGRSQPSPAPAACPASWSAATTGVQRCSGKGACSFPEGSCECTVPSSCSGTPQVEREPGPARWVCEPARPGCPQTAPSRGATCDTDGAACSYQRGCCDIPVRCEHGVWVEGDKSCPG